MSAPTYTYADLARIFHRSPDNIQPLIRGWICRRHFPAPVARGVFSVERVNAWIAAPDDDARFALAIVQARDEIAGASTAAAVIDFTERMKLKYGRAEW